MTMTPLFSGVTTSARAKDEKPLLLVFSHLRWNFVYQRPQHLISRAAGRYRVFFIEEPVFEGTGQPRMTLHPQGGVNVAVPVLPVGYPEDDVQETLRDLVDGLVADNPATETVHWFYTPMALDFADHLRADITVYDCMDELSAFRGAPAAMRENEQRLFQRADLVFCGGVTLYESKRKQHRNVHAFPSSIDRAHFAKALTPGASEPADQRDIPHKRVGFYGVIDERLDTELVGRLAELRPDLHFVILGPVVKIDPASLPQAANIHWLGGKDYKELPAYLAGWDAAFMPFALNESTRFISPTKTPEFLSAHLPVVSTPITDVVKPYGAEGLVEIATGAEEMSRALDRLLSRQTEPWLTKVDAKLATMSWDRTWANMDALIAPKLRARRMPLPRQIAVKEAASRV